ncbi:MAG: methyltransferase [Alphaproteobacteria bacterium]|jgi:tRNA1(Val) A37 N6-methylase TrmN6|nr:methyltransferase [Rhodospirillaceae bacterium]MDG2481335.1 methyltransferase [Alphaproteobacteria bacterium]MBT6203087.1 methyltransferase [Rhodospirillaceae bacterium]MBT6510103.1 methyltransferase [Rhodospirillaceae bacterium]MBT7614753.1 methyltransferase [Rhodospirillaceae bacterium]
MSDGPESPVSLLGGAVSLVRTDGLKPTTDTALLAAAVMAAEGMHVLDAGAGSGGAALCLAHRVAGISVTALEREAEPAAAARANVEANRFGDRVVVVEADLADAGKHLARESFDVVMTNPPYLDPATTRGSPDRLRRAATVESMNMACWLEFCLALLKPGGEILVVHRADREETLVAALGEGTGALEIMELRAGGAKDAPARRILIRARKGEIQSSRRVTPLVLHGDDGRYTEAAEAVLRHGDALPWLANGCIDPT